MTNSGEAWTAKHDRDGAPNGGSARGYQELSALSAIATTAEQVGGQAVCFSLSHKP